MKHKVIVYSTHYCPWCVMAKELLIENQIPFEEVDVGASKGAAEDLFKLSEQYGVPVLNIDGHIVTGFNEGQIRKLLGI